MAHYEPMDYQLTGFAEMCMGSAVDPIDMTEERQDRRYEEAAEESDEEAAEESEDEPPPPVPPPLVRQNACTGPHGRAALSIREQELRYIEEHGLVEFCNGAIVTAMLQDADYLLAQLTYLGRR